LLGYLEVSIFGDQTNRLFTKVKGSILDLRGNGGGLLTSAVELAGHFLPKGTLITKTKYSNFKPIDYKSKGF